jgi:hypothetical protein
MRTLGARSFLLLVLLIVAGAQSAVLVWADGEFGVTSPGTGNEDPNYLICTRATLSEAGTVTHIDFYSGVSGNVKVGIYSDSSGPSSLLVGPVEKTGSTAGAWNDVTVTSTALTAGTYWLCVDTNIVGGVKYSSGGTVRYRVLSYASSWPSPGGSGWASATYSESIHAFYTTGPPPADFTITATPPSQNVGAGSTASFTLNLAAGGGFNETVNLAVTSGCPSGVTCTVTPDSISSFPGSSTLSVPTLITTTGTYSVVVTASSTSKTHTVTATVNVQAPASYSFNVKSGATQIVVTLTYAWSGSGTPPAGSITIVGPGGTPQYGESSGAVYDRTSIAVSGSSSAYTVLHRVTFTVSGITSPQVWTALVSLASVSTYNVMIEVS